jgi:hypothetical protein
MIFHKDQHGQDYAVVDFLGVCKVDHLPYSLMLKFSGSDLFECAELYILSCTGSLSVYREEVYAENDYSCPEN